MEYFNPGDIAERIMAALEKEKKNMKVMNVMLLGKTGVGKSTLINNLFNERLAETGVGRPVTQEIKQYKKDGVERRNLSGTDDGFFSEIFAGMTTDYERSDTLLAG